MRLRCLLQLGFAAGYAALASVALGQVPAYTYVDLGTLRGKGTTVTSINNAGQIAGDGWYEFASSTSGPFTSNARAFRITPATNGDSMVWAALDSNGLNSLMSVFSLQTTYKYSEALAINSAGAVAGQMLGDGYTTPQDALYGNTNLVATALPSDSCWAWGINDLSTIVGEIIPPKGGGTQPTIWKLVGSKWTATNLGIGSNTQARAINNYDQVVGTDGNVGVAYLWLPSPAYGLPSGKNSLGTFGGPVSYAYAVNDLGHVVGYATDPGKHELPYLWTPPTDTTDFGVPGALLNLTTPGWAEGYPRALTTPTGSQPLQVVGGAANAFGQGRAFIWDSNGRTMRDLNVLVTNPPQEGMVEARGINSSGLIVGNAKFTLPNGGQVDRPFLLIPNAQLPDAASVPASASALSGTANSTSEVSLSWTDVASDENGYKVDRSTNGTSWTQVASLPADSAMHTDINLVQAMQYTYRVSPFNVKGYGTPAETVVITPGVPLAPTGCALLALSSTSIRVRWRNNSNIQTSVTVEYATDSTFSTGRGEVTVGGSVTEQVLSGLKPNTTYYVHVRGNRTGYGSSGWSNAPSATTPRR